ncbi:SIR2 family NAD-dependent protein deacylase [Paraburkholderia sp. XV]|nr:Sir2 family NAD-dependent protein deacetylase [Paraburkholderia sp. XV]
MDENERIRRAVSWLREADGMLVTAGAGMGVDSGLPDYRGTEGFWRAYPPLKQHRLTFRDMANPRVMALHPRLCWGFYGHRLDLYRRTVPHRGFEILLRWAKSLPRGLAVFTSNVDGQFQAAGFDSGMIAECHGSIHVLQCSEVCHAGLWPATGVQPVVDESTCELVSDLPRCPQCGAVARPNILMFGDYDWIALRTEQQEVRLQAWLSKLERPVVIEIGAGKAIPTVRDFSEQNGPRVIRINPRDFGIAPHRGIGLARGAIDGLELLDRSM